MLFDFDTSHGGLQYVTDDKWIEELGIRYHLGVDGLSLWMIVLTALLFSFSALWVVLRRVERPRLFAFHMGVAETAVLGAFMAQDLALFVLFFDRSCRSAFLVLGWGGPGPAGGDDQVLRLYARGGSPAHAGGGGGERQCSPSRADGRRRDLILPEPNLAELVTLPESNAETAGSLTARGKR